MSSGNPLLRGMQQEGHQGTDPVREGSKEDACERSTIRAAGLPLLLPLPRLCAHLPGASSMFRP